MDNGATSDTLCSSRLATTTAGSMLVTTLNFLVWDAIPLLQKLKLSTAQIVPVVQLLITSGVESKTFTLVTKDLLNGMFHRQLRCVVYKLRVLFNSVKVGQVVAT